MPRGTFIETRKGLLKIKRKYPGLFCTGLIETFDKLSPGWKRAKGHWIVGDEDETGYSPDILYELPGRVFVRGWDMTMAINARKKD